MHGVDGCDVLCECTLSLPGKQALLKTANRQVFDASDLLPFTCVRVSLFERRFVKRGRGIYMQDLKLAEVFNTQRGRGWHGAL